ncbi:MAG: hypothetical protein J6Q68_02970 [Clostridia bacterium]|nr:hypothetical protein [Clostridia bacterium]
MIIENLGNGTRCKEALRLLVEAQARGEIPASFKRFFLLPIPTTRDKMHLSGTDKLVSEVFADLKEGDFVAGYGIERNDKNEARERGAIVYDAACDEEFLAENAEQSALGALGYILSNIDTAPSETEFAIVGYGRIGSRLVRMLLFLGGKVKIYTTNEKTCIELNECGIDAHLIDREAPILKTDAKVIINTAPTNLAPSFPSGKIPHGTRIIELASGENFGGIDGIERLPGIPDKYYGKSAGKNYFSKFMDYMNEVTKK